MNTIEGKIAVGAPRSEARYINAHRICADCLELTKTVLGDSAMPYRALAFGTNDFASYDGTCYVCEQTAHVAVVEYSLPIVLTNAAEVAETISNYGRKAAL